MKDHLVKIRFARESDLPKLKKLDTELTRKQLSGKVQAHEVVVAEHLGALLGCLRIEFMWTKIPYITWIFVSKTFRNQDIAASLLRFLKERLKKNGHKFLLSSFQNNAPLSRRWHKKVGFKTCGKVDLINTDGSSEIFCRLKLT